MLPESSITLLENIHSTGITYDDCGDCNMLVRLFRDKQSSLLGQFVSYGDNEVLLIPHLCPDAVFLVVCDPSSNEL
jgi:hypothetical protein